LLWPFQSEATILLLHGLRLCIGRQTDRHQGLLSLMVESLSIPGYDILRELGRGGMASVYLAMQRSFERQVALKVMSPLLNSDPSFATRFMREARIVAHIHHSSIVPVFDVGHAAPHHYMSMEFLPAGDLKQRILNGDFGPALAYGVCMTIAAALDLAHRKGFVHRDIKPENILFREDGTAVLTDFGIARAIDAGTSLTVAGTFVGTPNYMSPEQVKGLELDGRSDLYSLGIVFYEMLTGDVPFHANSGFSIALKQLGESLPPLPRAVAAYQAFVDKLTAKEPAARFATGAEVIEALQKIGAIKVTGAIADTQSSRVEIDAQQGETLLRPRGSNTIHSPVAAAVPKLQPAKSSFNWRSPQAAWLSIGFVALVGIVVFAVSREPTHAPATKPAPEPIVAAPQILPAVAPTIAAAPAPTEPVLRASAAAATSAASKRAAELRLQQELQQQELQQQVNDEQVASLLASANTQLANGALFEPAGANAKESYRAVLKLQSKQADALAGLNRISDLLAAEAVQSKAVGDRDALRRFIEEIQDIQPQHSLLAHLRRELERLETKPMVLPIGTQANLEKAAKLVAKANGDLNRKPLGFDDAESASEQYDKAAELAPFTPGLPVLKERIVTAYATVVQLELNKGEPKRAMKMLNFARERKWFSMELEQLEKAVKQR